MFTHFKSIKILLFKRIYVKIKKANLGLKKNRKKVITLIVAALAFTMTGCGSSTAISVSELTAESKPATQYTIDANQEVYALLDFEDTAECENATKGLLASPDTANPSLWRDTQLNHIYGLFEVTDGIYQVRDGNAWAEYIMESLALYGDKADVVFQSHNWSHWGNDTIQEYMTNTAAVYKFINDQTLLYINEGYTETEIANMIQLPEELEKVWYTRQYYGTVSHNSKAVYEKYMGWYDANPVHLAELTPSDYAQKLVEYFGDTDAVQKNAENVAALIEQEGDETCLTRLMDAVTVTSEYKYFNIIEP